MRLTVGAIVVGLTLASASSFAGEVRAPETTSQEPNAQLKVFLSDAWRDAIDVWQTYFKSREVDTETPQINFVAAVKETHCYGLYISAGPVYCFGNSTVFVSLAEMERLKWRIPKLGEPGLAFLVAHELGHHVQKITGRFRKYSTLVHNDMRRQKELALRLELDADCLAGVWAGLSPSFASSESVRAGMLTAVEAIGDDTIAGGASAKPTDPRTYTHGSAEQRLRWFKMGLDKPQIETCDALEATSF